MTSTTWILVATASLLGALPAAAEIPQIRHVVVVVQENRTPDNLFHGLKAMQPAADIADHGTTLGVRRSA
jgi:phospholipase C